MPKLMNKQGVLDLAKRLIDENPENLRSPEAYLSHLGDSYDNAERVVKEVCFKYPILKNILNVEKISLAGGLHDIGRPFKEDQLFHELRGAKYIQEHGLQLGVADNLVAVYKIAQMFRSHCIVSEQFAEENHKEQRIEFEPLDTSLLIQRTWQEAIVTYSELTIIKGERISFQEKMQDFKKNYAPGGKFAKTNPAFIKSLEKGLPRLAEVYERVQRLRQGKLKIEEIMQYGFL